MASFFKTQALALKLARRDFQGRSGGFWLLVTGLAFAITAFALVDSIANSVLDGVRGSARQAVGGDLALRLFHRPASPTERTYLETLGAVSEIAELRPLASKTAEARKVLVELKAVDRTYPLVGAMKLNPRQPLDKALAFTEGRFGAVAAPALLKKLNATVGDTVQLGNITVDIRAVIRSEPDKSLAAFALGPRLMISRQALTETGLATAGGPVYYYNRVELATPEKADAVIEAIEQRFPDAGWRIVNAADGVPGIERMAAIGRSLLILIGLSILLICGIGVAGGVQAHLIRKTKTIAILKSTGASRGMISSIYLWQVLFALTLAAIIGCLLGAGLHQGAMIAVAPHLPFDWTPQVEWTALGTAVLFGLLTAVLFAVWPLDRACSTPPQKLFKHQMKPQRTRHTFKAVAIMAVAATAIGLLVMVATATPLFAIIFSGAVGIAVLAFFGLGRAVGWLARRIHLPNHPVLRIAVSNIGRPGAPTGSMIMTLGLTLTLLVALLTLDRHAGSHLADTLPRHVPDLAFLNIQPEEIASFTETLSAQPGVTRLEDAPFVHGRLTAVNGTPVSQWGVPKDISWVLRGDRGLSWRNTPSPKGRLVAGKWWGKDEQGALLASLDAKVADRLRVGLGDTLTLNIMGRPYEATIVNLRAIDWTRLELDFPILLSTPPHPIAHTRVAALWGEADHLAAIENTAATLFPLAPFIRVPEVVGQLTDLAGNIASALVAVSASTVGAAFFVLAGALSAGYRRRVKEMALLKVIGARPKQIALACTLEMAIVAFAATLLASLLGTGAAYGIVAKLLPGSWAFSLSIPGLLTLGTVATMGLIGYFLLRRKLYRQTVDLRRF